MVKVCFGKGGGIKFLKLDFKNPWVDAYLDKYLRLRKFIFEIGKETYLGQS